VVVVEEEVAVGVAEEEVAVAHLAHHHPHSLDRR
jgi:hypothetical protein